MTYPVHTGDAQSPKTHENMFNFSVSIVLADHLLPLGAWSFASTVILKSGPICVRDRHIEQQIK